MLVRVDGHLLMKYSFLAASCVFLALIFALLSFGKGRRDLPFVVPPGWPKPLHDFAKNPVTEAGFLLGSRLFYDPVLSKDSTISCASCHLSFTAFTHIDHRLSHGIYGRMGIRNSPALINLAWSGTFMWDGAAKSLAEQAMHPITNPTEMDNTLDAVVQKLNTNQTYRARFYQAFGDSAASAEGLLHALSQFTVMLVSYNARYDSVMREDPGVSFTLAEEHGYQLFKANCSSCHAEPLFTYGAFENNGLAPDSALMDVGRMKVTGDPADAYKFKVPTLRNIAYSSPYFHDGRFNKLMEVLDHYTDGITESPTLAKELRAPVRLNKSEKKDLIAFLKTLTDRPFLYNRAFQFDFSDKF